MTLAPVAASLLTVLQLATHSVAAQSGPVLVDVGGHKLHVQVAETTSRVWFSSRTGRGGGRPKLDSTQAAQVTSTALQELRPTIGCRPPA